MGISFDPELGDAVRAAAVGKLRSEALARFLDDWEAEHGTLTPAEIAEAEQELVLGPPSNPVS